MDTTKALHKPSKVFVFLSIVEAPSQMFAWVCHEKSRMEAANREGL
jgi:hypothetical protein